MNNIKQIMIPAIPDKLENLDEVRKILLQMSIVLNDIKNVIKLDEESLFYNP